MGRMVCHLLTRRVANFADVDGIGTRKFDRLMNGSVEIVARRIESGVVHVAPGLFLDSRTVIKSPKRLNARKNWSFVGRKNGNSVSAERCGASYFTPFAPKSERERCLPFVAPVVETDCGIWIFEATRIQRELGS